jgi:dTDP-4-dehydrorhamnose reductase
MKKKPTILITGGAGYIGSHAVKEAARFDFVPVIYDNFSVGHPWAAQGAATVGGELKDRAKLLKTFKKFKPAAVMHFASHAAVGESGQSHQRPESFFRHVGTKGEISYFVFHLRHLWKPGEGAHDRNPSPKSREPLRGFQVDAGADPALV